MLPLGSDDELSNGKKKTKNKNTAMTIGAFHDDATGLPQCRWVELPLDSKAGITDLLI